MTLVTALKKRIKKHWNNCKKGKKIILNLFQINFKLNLAEMLYLKSIDRIKITNWNTQVEQNNIVFFKNLHSIYYKILINI